MRGPTQLDADRQPVNRRLSLARNVTRDANELCGVARGMLADGTINQLEAEYLLKWLSEHPEGLSMWPFNVLFGRLEEMLSDGVLDPEEEAELIDLLVDYTGGGSTSDGACASRNATTLPLCHPAPTVHFDGQLFVLTGKFATGTRDECEAALHERGAIPQKNPTQATNYLVIGNLGSSDWAQTSYGRKIQHAVELRDNGHPIHLISEEHWSHWLFR